MRRIYFPAAALLAITPFVPQDPQDAARAAREARELAATEIELVAMDYIDAIYDVRPRFLERSVHPEAVRFGFPTDPEESPFGSRTKMDYAELVELAGSFNRDGHIDEDAPREVKILDVVDVTASARITTAWGFDYLQLAKLEDKWLIVNILWQTFDHSTAIPDLTEDTVAVGAALFTSSRCVNCHGNGGTGSERAPNLADAEWVQSSGDLAGIRNTITNGVPSQQIKGDYPRAMGSFGNRLSPDEINSLAQYIWTLSHE